MKLISLALIFSLAIIGFVVSFPYLDPVGNVRLMNIQCSLGQDCCWRDMYACDRQHSILNRTKCDSNKHAVQMCDRTIISSAQCVSSSSIVALFRRGANDSTGCRLLFLQQEGGYRMRVESQKRQNLARWFESSSAEWIEGSDALDAQLAVNCEAF